MGPPSCLAHTKHGGKQLILQIITCFAASSPDCSDDEDSSSDEDSFLDFLEECFFDFLEDFFPLDFLDFPCLEDFLCFFTSCLSLFGIEYEKGKELATGTTGTTGAGGALKGAPLF